MTIESNVLSRRAFTKISAFGALAGAVHFANAEDAHAEHKHHHKMNTANAALVAEARHCVVSGEICLQHCFELFKTGDNSLADCAAAVQDMVASCSALVKLASYDSKHTKAMAQACVGILEDCKKECLKHKQHVQCKDCADACERCITECKKIIG